MLLREYGWFTIFVCIFVAFGGLLFGYDSANISGVIAMPNWLATFGYRSDGFGCGVSGVYKGEIWCISSTDKALITSMLSVGTFVGALSGAYVADHIGRRGGIITAGTVFVAGVTLQTGLTTIAGLIVGRVIAGLGVGLVSMMVPLYQAEAAPPAIRGSLVSFYQFAITVGILLAQVIDLGTQNIESSASWRIPIGLQILWGLLLIFGCLFIPESPRFLISRGKVSQGRASLARLRNHPADSPQINREMAEIEGNIVFMSSLGPGTYGECFRKEGAMLSRTMCGILVQMFQQLTGVNFVFYGTSFFKAAGIDKPYLITVATGVVNVGMTIPGIYLVERLGRRKFLLSGALWMSLCQLIIGVVAVTQAGTQAANHVLVAFTLLFIAGFASTWGPGAWVLISELYPLKLRGKAMSLATASNWFWNWVIAFIVPYITDPGYGNLGSKIAFIWFVTALLGALWTYFFVPETRRWSLEELDEMFQSGLKPWQTPHWTPTGASLQGVGATDDLKKSDEKLEDSRIA